LGEIITLWILNDFSIKKRTSIGTAIVEMGRLETWLLRYARGELDVRNGIGNYTSNLIAVLSQMVFHETRID
jgi:hypothetical protein